jgi:hypothetical protein
MCLPWNTHCNDCSYTCAYTHSCTQLRTCTPYTQTNTDTDTHAHKHTYIRTESQSKGEVGANLAAGKSSPLGQKQRSKLAGGKGQHLSPKKPQARLPAQTVMEVGAGLKQQCMCACVSVWLPFLWVRSVCWLVHTGWCWK